MSSAAPNVTPIDPVARELAAIEETRKQIRARIDGASAKAKAAAEDPAVKLAEAKIAMAKERLEADLAEHEIEADRVYREACLERGFDAVARVRTRAGSIVLRAMSETEADAMIARRDSFHRAAGPSPAEQMLAKNNGELAMMEGLRSTVLTPLDHFDRTMKRHHGLWSQLWTARNALIDGRVVSEGKGDAA